MLPDRAVCGIMEPEENNMELREMLGELNERKKLLEKRRPLSEAEIEEAQLFFKIDSVWSSNAIENNTISRDETSVIIGDGMTVGDHSLRELFETLGGASAYDFMYTLKDGKPITENDILKMHRLFAWNIPDIQPGEYRDCRVYMTMPDGTDHEFPAPEKVPRLMKDLMKWYEENRTKLHPAVLAADLHAKFVTIHPFRDGNGRVARLLANTVLIQNGFLPLAIPPIRKGDYNSRINAYQKRDSILPFRSFIAEMALMTMRDYMRMLGISYVRNKGIER